MTECSAKRHDTFTAYKVDKCRCPAARNIVREKQIEYRNRKKAGEEILVDATVTKRQLRALMGAGHTTVTLAQELGLRGRRNVHRIFTSQRVTPSTRDKVQALYDALQNVPGASQRLRLLGEARDWATPYAWDDITDPEATPVGLRETQPSGTPRLNKSKELVFEYQCIRDSGLSHEYALKELGVTHDAWQKAQKRA